MRKIHLAQLIPNKKLHIFHGYDEIIETIQWGLAQSGYEVTYEINRFEPSCTNIIFGAQMLGIEDLKRLPPDTIIYNLEQASGLNPDELRPSMKYCGEHFQIWDYSEFNMPTWRQFSSGKTPVHVPIGYAPTLSRIAKPENQEIDVLFYGGPGGQRLRIFNELCLKLAKTVFVCGLYGQSRDNLIANSKIIININQYPQFGIFEIARASYLLANSKAIVSDFATTSKIEPDIKNAIKFCPLEHIIQECLNLLDDDAARANLERNGFEIMRNRDIRQILANAALNI